MRRHKLSRRHPAIGDGYRLLLDTDVLQAGDETNCVSTMLSYDGSQWSRVGVEHEEDLGKTVFDVLGPESRDADKDERVYRRRIDA